MVFESFFAFWHDWMSRLILYISYHRPGMSCLRVFDCFFFFFQKRYLETMISASGVLLTELVIGFRPFKWTNLGGGVLMSIHREFISILPI